MAGGESPSRVALTLPSLNGLRLSWLADAELCLRPNGTATGLSLYFWDAFEWEAFLELGLLSESQIELDKQLRNRFELDPRRWVKLHVGGGTSQYFTIDPRIAYPITTIRMALRMMGCSDVSKVETGFRCALERGDTLWAVIAKGTEPRLACRVHRSLFTMLLQSIEAAGLSENALAYEGVDRQMDGGEYVYLSIDLIRGDLALDYEHVQTPPAACFDAWAEDGPSYLKVRLIRGEPSYSIYRPLAPLVPLADDRDVREEARSYYDREADAILQHFGGTYQSGHLPDLVERTGIQAGELVLDSGCGSGGPAAQLVWSVPGCRVVGVTLSSRQAEHGSVPTVTGDYHQLPFRSESFDRVLFLESMGYAENLSLVILEAHRVLKPSGSLYIKDVFLPDRVLTASERLNLAEFDHVYAQRTPALASMLAALQAAGFTIERTEPLNSKVDMNPFYSGMVTAGRLNAFGKQHYRAYRHLPVEFHDILVSKRSVG